jgi:ABC-2 type transport system ATP-binding protein
VDVALGIVGDPDLLFLDEPTTGFDPSARREAWRMIDGLRELGRTIVLTTHYMDEAQRLADRVAIMRGGELVATGTVDEIGRTLGEGVIVRFRIPAGVSAEAIATTLLAPVETTGDEVTIRTSDAQRLLYRLTGWAEEAGLRLDGLEVARPRLDDMYLELMAPEASRD